MVDSILFSLLKEVGVGVGTNAVYDAVKRYVMGTHSPNIEGLRQALQDSLSLNSVSISAASIIDLMATRGAIVIKGSNLYGPNGVSFTSNDGIFSLGHGSTSRTDKTAIRASGSGAIVGTGRSAVVQHDDGSIRFLVGDNGNLTMTVGRD